MRPTKTLIRGLRETAQRLRKDSNDYYWSMGATCNCGMLAQTLLGVSERALSNLGAIGNWTTNAELAYCGRTGLSVVEMFKALDACGVERHDFERIEYLDDKDKNSFDDPLNVAAWMDAEADKLEARRAAGEKPEVK